MKKYALLFNLLLSLLTPVNSMADPSQEINWLMDEEASLFDIGQIRLDLKVRQELLPSLLMSSKKYKNIDSVFSGSGYDFSDNKIIIYATFYYEGKEDICKDIALSYRNTLFLTDFSKKDEIGNKYDKLNEEILDDIFSHVGYKKNNRPKTIGKNLFERTFFRINIINLSNSEKTSCELNAKTGHTIYEK